MQLRSEELQCQEEREVLQEALWEHSPVTIISNGLTINGVNSFWQMIISAIDP